MRQDFFNIIILDCHIFFCFTKAFVYNLYGIHQSCNGTLIFFDDFFPIPLVDKDRVDIVGDFIAADGIHIRVKSFAVRKTIFFQSISFPFCKGLDNFSFPSVLFFDIKCNRAFHTV